MKHKILNSILPLLAILLFPVSLMAIPGGPPIDDDPVDPAPIDNWMLLLAFAGILIGAYLVFKFHRKSASIEV